LIFLAFSVGLPELALLAVEDLPGEVVAGLLPVELSVDAPAQ
jgi:hypothetical protein